MLPTMPHRIVSCRSDDYGRSQSTPLPHFSRKGRHE
jgi:hypothetical protein